MTRAISIADIQAVAATYFRVSVAELKSPIQERRVARPRQVAMYLARKLALSTHAEIGRHFGDRDHTTVMHACRQVGGLMEHSTSFRAQVDELRSLIADRERAAA